MPAPAPAEAFPPRQPNVENGRVLFNIGGCTSCHAKPGQEDKTRLGGGLALNTPFGTFKVPNISPDESHGIGRWTERDFANAMLRGVGRDGEHLFPSFPYTSYQRMPLGDVRDNLGLAQWFCHLVSFSSSELRLRMWPHASERSSHARRALYGRSPRNARKNI